MNEKIRFVSKAEREQIRLAQEQEKLDHAKRVMDENKKRRREFVKETHVIANDPQTIIPREDIAKPVVSKFKFEWDASEDTSALAEETNAAKQGSKTDPLNKLDARLATSRLDLLHWSKKLTGEMQTRDWRIFREDNEISVSGSKGRVIPTPFRAWSESSLPRDLLDAIVLAGYTKPTPIQMQAIPLALEGVDLIGISSTGSGKTAAFILPMFVYIKKTILSGKSHSLGQDGPLALILAPSRELAIQIEQEAVKFASFCKIKTCTIVGGRSAEQQTMTLSQGVELVVATPGRLADSLDAKQTVLNQCFYVVLDEADKMVDLGFESYLNRILDSIPATQHGAPEVADESTYRITQMFSATMPVSVEKLTRKYLYNPVTVTIGDVGGRAKADIEQRIEFVKSEKDKRRILLEIISATQFPAIVFVNSKRSADYVGQTLDGIGHRVIVLHSGKMQDKREEAIRSFKAGKSDILVATDVAGRGIDIAGVQHVINYDMAKNIEDYTHRIGRTGRAGLSGLATSFINLTDEETAGVLPDLKKFLQQAKQYVPEELVQIADHKRKRDSTIYIA